MLIGGHGPYRDFGFLSFSSVTLMTWQHGPKENNCNFATFNRIFDTWTIIIKKGPNINTPLSN